MNFLPYAESVKLKELGIDLLCDFYYAGEYLTDFKTAIKFYPQLKHTPAPTATEMLAIMPKEIHKDSGTLEMFRQNEIYLVGYTNIESWEHKNLLIALSNMLKWLRQERYI